MYGFKKGKMTIRQVNRHFWDKLLLQNYSLVVGVLNIYLKKIDYRIGYLSFEN